MQNVILYPHKKHIHACSSGSGVVVNVIGPSPTLVWWFKNVPPFTNLRIQYFGEPL